MKVNYQFLIFFVILLSNVKGKSNEKKRLISQFLSPSGPPQMVKMKFIVGIRSYSCYVS